MNKCFYLILLSTALFIPSLSANNRYPKGVFRLVQSFARSQPIGPPRPAQVARETRAGITPEAAARNAAIETLRRMNAEPHVPRKTRTLPLCSPTTRENSMPPQNFEVYKSRHGNFAHFKAIITVKEFLNGENLIQERVMVFHDNTGAQKVMKTANKLAAECAREPDVNISWELVQYDDLNNENESLDDLD